MSTYRKHGYQHSRFNLERSNTYDSLGRSFGREFLEQYKYNVEDIDSIPSLPRPDLWVKKRNEEYEVEVEIKGNDIWHFHKKGLDIPYRKSNFIWSVDIKHRFHLMIKEDGTEVLITSMGWEKCAKNHEHGCFIHLKSCRAFNGKGRENNDFMRIPYRFLRHFRRTHDNLFTLIQPGDTPYDY